MLSGTRVLESAACDRCRQSACVCVFLEGCSSYARSSTFVLRVAPPFLGNLPALSRLTIALIRRTIISQR